MRVPTAAAGSARELTALLHADGAILVRELADSDSAAAVLAALAQHAGLRRTHHILGGPAAAAAANRGMFSPERLRPIVTAEGTRSGRQGVEPGSEAIEPHRENGYLPWSPDIIAFYCRKPADTGGETILVDGVALWSHLTPLTRELFASQRLRFDSANSAISELLGIAPGSELARSWTDLRVDDAGRYTYCPRAILTTAAGATAFCNSVVGPYPWRPRFEDGTEVPAEALADIRRVHRELAADLALAPGDLIIIDNNRVLHGRRAFTGLREMYIYMYTSKPIPDSLVTTP